MKRSKSAVVSLLPLSFLTVAALLLFFRQAQAPPPWFDEGWVMSVAKNWVQIGHYGQLLNGKLASASMLNVGFPAIGPIALSFRALGFGIWQGRLPSILFTLASLLLIYRFAGRLFDSRIANGTLFILIFASPLPTILYGKQALGELPLLFYVLAGFLCFLNSWNHPKLYIPLTVAFWALAMATKQHLLPFLLASLLIPFVLAVRQRCYRSARYLGATFVGSLTLLLVLRQVQEFLLHDRIMRDSGVYFITAFVPLTSVRIAALWVTIILGFTTILGLLSEFRNRVWPLRNLALRTGEENARLVLFILVSSWTAWYVALSIGWQRYLFVPVFLGTVFFANFLSRITAKYDILFTIRKSALLFRFGNLNLAHAAPLLALLLVILGLARNANSFYSSHFLEADDSLASLIDYVDNHLSSQSLVECYDWEVLFSLKCRYHLPPDDVQLNLDRRAFLGQQVPINYDPLAADPDYLIIGEQSRFWQLYDKPLENGQFRLMYGNARYSLYKRMR